MANYDIVGILPAARFYYKGTHSHPVRRTVLIIESHPTYLRGYELREGSVVREMSKSPVKSYSRSKIARESDLGARKHRKPGPDITTLKRMTLLDLLKTGI
jgi:hypothetical protein